VRWPFFPSPFPPSLAVCKHRWRFRAKLTNIQVPARSYLLRARRDYSKKNQLESSFSREVGGKPNTIATLRARLPPPPPSPPSSPSFFIRKQVINPNSVRGSADNECNKNTRANNNSELERNMLRGLPSPRNAPPFSPPSASPSISLSLVGSRFTRTSD